MPRLVLGLGLALVLLGGCSSGMGSSMTGPSSRSSQAGTPAAGSDTGGGRAGTEMGGNQMM